MGFSIPQKLLSRRKLSIWSFINYYYVLKLETNIILRPLTPLIGWVESLHYTSINSIDIATVKKQLRTGVGIISSFSFTQSHGCHPYQEKKKKGRMYVMEMEIEARIKQKRRVPLKWKWNCKDSLQCSLESSAPLLLMSWISPLKFMIVWNFMWSHLLSISPRLIVTNIDHFSKKKIPCFFFFSKIHPYHLCEIFKVSPKLTFVICSRELYKDFIYPSRKIFL